MTPPSPVSLDWSGRDGARHWGGGALRSCRTCHEPALLIDDQGRPQHKACAEAEAVRAPTAVRTLAPEAVLDHPEAEVTW
jgi:hypothetical protein